MKKYIIHTPSIICCFCTYLYLIKSFIFLNIILILQSVFGYMVRIMGVCVPTCIVYIIYVYYAGMP